MFRLNMIDIGVSRCMPVVLLASFALASCTTQEQPRPPITRQVKVQTVTTQPAQGQRLFATIRSQQRAELSFEFAGLLEQVLVRAGQQVHAGQVLAQLDRRAAQFKLDKAKAQLAAQNSQARQAQQALKRSRRLLDEGAVAKKEFEQAQSQYQTRVAQRAVGEAAVKLAARDYAATQLKAPFDGRIVSYDVEPHSRIAAAQTIIRMDSPAKWDVIAQVPVELARALSVGSKAIATYANQATDPLHLELRSLSPEAKRGMLQEAKFDVVSGGAGLVDGDTVSVQVVASKGAVVMTLARQALRGSANSQQAQVFVYQPQSRQVVLRPVVLGAAQGSALEIRAGLEPGEQVVTAGAAFLSDRQTVSLFKPINSAGAE